MLFQASAEKSEPTCATHRAMSRPNVPAAAETDGIKDRSQSAPGSMACGACGVHMALKFALTAAAFLPTRMPSRIRPTSASVLAEVKMFWIHLPSRRPRVLAKVRRTISATATPCCKERLTAYLEESRMGGKIQAVGETAGTSTPRNRAKPTETAAIVPVWITRNNVQP